MEKKILEIKNICVSYDGHNVLKNITLEFERGKSYALVGPSGAGKSTLLKAIDGLLPPNATFTGDVLLEGKRIENYDNIRGKEIFFLLQDPKNQFNPTYKIGKQLERAIKLNQNINHRAIKKKAMLALEKAGLSNEVYNLYPHQISGGMLQRANLAIEITKKAPLVLLDEPTSGLDVELQDMLLYALIEEQKERNGTLVYVTHNFEDALKADCIVVLDNGIIEQEGESKYVFCNPKSQYMEKAIKADCYD